MNDAAIYHRRAVMAREHTIKELAMPWKDSRMEFTAGRVIWIIFIRSRLKPLSCKKTLWNIAGDTRRHPASSSISFSSPTLFFPFLGSGLPLSAPLRHFGFKVKGEFGYFSETPKKREHCERVKTVESADWMEETFHGGYVFHYDGVKIWDNWTLRQFQSFQLYVSFCRLSISS